VLRSTTKLAHSEQEEIKITVMRNNHLLNIGDGYFFVYK